MDKIKLFWNKFCIFVRLKVMKTYKPNRKAMKSPIEYMEDKKYIRAYLKGEKTRSELDERGIKLAMPL